MRRLLVLAALLPACATPPPRPAPPATAPTAPPPVARMPPPPLSTPAPAPSPRPPVDVPAPATCALHGDPIAWPDAVPLRLHEDGPPFAFARLAQGDVSPTLVPHGDGAPGYVALVDADVASLSPASSRLRLRALVAVADVRLYASTLMGCGTMWTKRGTPLALEAVGPVSLVVRLDEANAQIVSMHSGALLREVTCTEVALAPVAPASHVAPPSSVVAPVASASLHVTDARDPDPDSECTLELRVTPDTRLAIVTADAQRTRIRVDLGDAVVDGWVDTPSLVTKPASASAPAPAPAPAKHDAPLPDPSARIVRCDHDVPLDAYAGGDERRVGMVPAGMPVAVVHVDAGVATVALPSVDLTVAPAAALHVPAAALAGCAQ